MSVVVLHGENLKDSRARLRELINTQKEKGITQTYLNGDKITKQKLETKLLTNNLFSKDSIIIENLLSSRKSKQKTLLLEFLSSYKGGKDIILWEKKKITKTTLNKLKPLKMSDEHFKVPLIIFKFTNQISPNKKAKSLSLFHKALESSSDTFIFIMLARQISKLITAKTDPDLLKGARWQKSKVHAQANQWTIDKLIKTHTKLLNIDKSIKTGKTKLDLTSQLDLLIMEL